MIGAAATSEVTQLSNLLGTIRGLYSKGLELVRTISLKKDKLEQERERWENSLQKYELPSNHSVKKKLKASIEKLKRVQKDVRAVEESNFFTRLFSWCGSTMPSPAYVLSELTSVNDVFDELDSYVKDPATAGRGWWEVEADRNQPAISFSHDDKYVPISQTLKKVQAALQDNSSSKKVVLLHGRFGAGKSTLAKYLPLYYYDKLRGSSSSSSSSQELKFCEVAFIPWEKDTDSLKLMSQLIGDLGYEVPPPDTTLLAAEYKKMLLVRLGEGNNALIILDDVQDPRLLEDLVVQSAHIKYLVTSQRTNIWPEAVSVLIESPSLEEGRLILANHIFGRKMKDFPLEVKVCNYYILQSD
ncbi:hypothetical protein R1flu_015480 [Riccia fluitans]|uniref:NB-ARC domain-containing protein n=1 Tax=Riccia fluitans TaxID=41844 RepID=A0ABD1YK38_9MARC